MLNQVLEQQKNESYPTRFLTLLSDCNGIVV